MNNIHFTTLQRIVLLVSFLGTTLISLGQKKQGESFFTQMTEKEANLNSVQRQKLEIYRSNPVYKEVQLVKVGNLREHESRGVLTFQIPDRKGELTAKVTYVDLISESDYTWNGEFTGNNEGSIAILTKDGAVFGQMNIGTEAYVLRDLGSGINALLLMNGELLDSHECGNKHHEKEEQKQKNYNTQNRVDCRSQCNNVVRLLIMFTPNAARGLNLEQEGLVFIDQINRTLRNGYMSIGDLVFELAGVEELEGFVETNNPNGDLDRFRGLLENNDLRTVYGADLAILMTDGHYPGVIGTSYLEEWGREDYGYALAELSFSYWRYTFTHEIGHLFGARHENDNVNDPPQFPVYARGYNFIPADGIERKTMMSRAVNFNDIRILHFSNPSVFYQGHRTGVINNRNNARQMREAACIVKDYRDLESDETLNGTIFGPTLINVDGVTNHTWRAEACGCSDINSYAWEWSLNGFDFFPTGNNSSTLTLRGFPVMIRPIFIRYTFRCSTGQTHRTGVKVVLPQNCYNRNCKIDISTLEEEKANLIAYPNPASHSINIQIDLKEKEDVEIVLKDITGKTIQIIHRGKLDKGIHFLESTIQKEYSGLYFIEVKEGEKCTREKIMIKK